MIVRFDNSLRLLFFVGEGETVTTAYKLTTYYYINKVRTIVVT